MHPMAKLKASRRGTERYLDDGDDGDGGTVETAETAQRPRPLLRPRRSLAAEPGGE